MYACQVSEPSQLEVDFMMTATNGNIFRVTGPLCGEFTGHLWIPLTEDSYVVLWCFLLSSPDKAVK